ncbi:MAG: [FeFe] hydrogenase H-cluster radical SAM maturase HydG [candidate division KSB1 bacterium]|nr:[FeFe] hydrogenase H-cluster radical SAM maturase HydG [candidate division KSB1 bacterium]
MERDWEKEAERIIDEARIHAILDSTRVPESSRVDEILAKAGELKGLSLEDTASLLNVSEPDDLEKIFAKAREVKEAIYGRRLVLFAPLYVSNECVNNCLYCAFRRDNRSLPRRTLSLEEIREEVSILESKGHKRLLLVSSEHPRKTGIDYLEQAIATVYSTRNGRGEIRRLNVNAAAMSLEDFRRLKASGIGTYQLFQETYHRGTYERVHPSGPKRDFAWHLTAMNRAQEAGIDDVGLGVLYGLYDYRYEVLATLMHAQYLEREYGVGPHTISVPRIEPAENAPLAEHVPYPVSDLDFKKLVAVLRLAVPYTGIILTTRERAELRNELFSLGVSQISAGSRTAPGAYRKAEGDAVPAGSQFSLGDHRSLDEVIYEICRMGYIPSFCTACYRLGRTGQDFMDLAKPGLIQQFCAPNAILTFAEYLEDYASERTREVGWRAIRQQLDSLPNSKLRARTEEYLQRIRMGERDLFV